MIPGWEAIPGLQRVMLQEGMALANLGNISPQVAGKLPGRVGDFEWRLCGIEHEITLSSVTTDSSPSVVWDVVRGWSPIDIAVDGWNDAPYKGLRGDANRILQLMQLGKILGRSAATLPASVTTGAMRQRYMYPFAYMAGTTWYDSAPRADLLDSVQLGRTDALASADSYVADPTHSWYAWIAPCAKLYEVSIPFSASSWLISALNEISVPGADRLLAFGCTRTTNAFTNTTTLDQLSIGGRNMLPKAIPLHALVAEFNRSFLPEGAQSADALLEVVAATGAAASPEVLPLYGAGGLIGRNYLKQLTGARGASGVFSADLGTSGQIHGWALRAWDPLPGSDVEGRYVAAIQKRDRGFQPRDRAVTSIKDGPFRAGLPYRLVG